MKRCSRCDELIYESTNSFMEFPDLKGAPILCVKCVFEGLAGVRLPLATDASPKPGPSGR